MTVPIVIGTIDAESINMSKIINYRDLEVWQRAIELTDVVYDITAKFPERERFGLSALGEHTELETQGIIAERRHYISATDMKLFERLADSRDYAVTDSTISLTQLRP